MHHPGSQISRARSGNLSQKSLGVLDGGRDILVVRRWLGLSDRNLLVGNGQGLPQFGLVVWLKKSFRLFFKLLEQSDGFIRRMLHGMCRGNETQIDVLSDRVTGSLQHAIRVLQAGRLINVTTARSSRTSAIQTLALSDSSHLSRVFLNSIRAASSGIFESSAVRLR